MIFENTSTAHMEYVISRAKLSRRITARFLYALHCTRVGAEYPTVDDAIDFSVFCGTPITSWPHSYLSTLLNSFRASTTIDPRTPWFGRDESIGLLIQDHVLRMYQMDPIMRVSPVIDIDTLRLRLLNTTAQLFVDQRWTFEPRWLNPTTRGLADAIYEERAWDTMPILADALEDAGCDCEIVLKDLRNQKKKWFRGVLIIDLLTGRK